jgi:hypothetical protein
VGEYRRVPGDDGPTLTGNEPGRYEGAGGKIFAAVAAIGVVLVMLGWPWAAIAGSEFDAVYRRYVDWVCTRADGTRHPGCPAQLPAERPD